MVSTTGTSAHARAVLARLQQPGDQYAVVLPRGGYAWDPSKPWGPYNTIFGRAVARYRLDESGMVHLSYSPEEGPDRDVSGPRPELPPASRAGRWMIRGYLLANATAFGAAVWLVNGSVGVRLAAGGAALLAVMVLVHVVTVLLHIFLKPSTLGIRSESPALEPAMDPAVPAHTRSVPTSPTYQDLLQAHAPEMRDLKRQMGTAAGVFVLGWIVFSLPWVMTGIFGFVSWFSSLVWFAVSAYSLHARRRDIERRLLEGSAEQPP